MQVYVRMDQPNTALEQYGAAAARHPAEPALLLGQARIHDALNNMDQGVELYKQACMLHWLQRQGFHW